MGKRVFTVFLPILIGVAAAVLSFLAGSRADAPGLTLMGGILAFFLILWAVYNSGLIQKRFVLPIILFCFGAGGLFLSALLFFDGEFGDRPWLALVGLALGALLLVAGALRLRKVRKKGQNVSGL